RGGTKRNVGFPQNQAAEYKLRSALSTLPSHQPPVTVITKSGCRKRTLYSAIHHRSLSLENRAAGYKNRSSLLTPMSHPQQPAATVITKSGRRAQEQKRILYSAISPTTRYKIRSTRSNLPSNPPLPVTAITKSGRRAHEQKRISYSAISPTPGYCHYKNRLLGTRTESHSLICRLTHHYQSLSSQNQAAGYKKCSALSTLPSHPLPPVTSITKLSCSVQEQERTLYLAVSPTTTSLCHHKNRAFILD
ncbi:hypothetical protein J6590_075039, partial [Homalodisca vitripennis]